MHKRQLEIQTYANNFCLINYILLCSVKKLENLKEPQLGAVTKCLHSCRETYSGAAVLMIQTKPRERSHGIPPLKSADGTEL